MQIEPDQTYDCIRHIESYYILQLLVYPWRDFNGDPGSQEILHYNADRSKGLINPSQLLIDDQAMDVLKEVYKDDFIKLGY